MGHHMKNLARVWRPARFEDITGQDIIVRLLRNSLYRDRIFPAYLLMGQRGCGKTTIARVFAAALNCSKYDDFRNAPKECVLPCGICCSCESMLKGTHPDFIEIDAASHNGVDDVRMMTETVVLLPQLGRKRVYLIDEAHMLSKAACNALLKTLEEPPPSIVFMLATTDAHKIIDTVRSRCFPLSLRMHEKESIVARLSVICEHEGVAYTSEALHIIAEAAEGSLRDALNMVEQTILTYGRVDSDETRTLLGAVSLELVVHLLELMALRRESDLISFLEQSQVRTCDIYTLWREIGSCFQALVLLDGGVIQHDWKPYEERLRVLLKQMTLSHVLIYWERLFHAESMLIKTAHKHMFLEMLLVMMCYRSEVSDAQKIDKSSPPQNIPQKVTVREAEQYPEKRILDQPPQKTLPSIPGVPLESPLASVWEKVKGIITQERDQLKISIIQQMKPEMMSDKQWRITIPATLKLWQDVVLQIKKQIQEVISQELQQSIMIDISFFDEVKSSAPAAPPARVQKSERAIEGVAAEDKEMIRKILTVFPGTVTQVKEIA